MRCRSTGSTPTGAAAVPADQALPRIEAARDVLLAEISPHLAGAGRKARKRLIAATALADASVEVARYALAEPPARPRRRGRRLTVVLVGAGLVALVVRKARPRTRP